MPISIFTYYVLFSGYPEEACYFFEGDGRGVNLVAMVGWEIYGEVKGGEDNPGIKPSAYNVSSLQDVLGQ